MLKQESRAQGGVGPDRRGPRVCAVCGTTRYLGTNRGDTGWPGGRSCVPVGTSWGHCYRSSLESWGVWSGLASLSSLDLDPHVRVPS